eukprot:TRINITY_DN7661_c0_g1_i3.p1 TRINITY_DN7661_c0_g1~~TRINITY_DN7661_c0_g1_i3.p1  ORF type:complete len:1183 (+),score=311.41 TRINITY_DN7661_c0_g1_i3:100-3648(+)
MATINDSFFGALSRRFKKPPEKTRVLHANERNEKYPSNRVTNTKYTVLTFLPKNLYEQFHTFMNIYFLVIGLLQLSPTLTPVNPLSTWGGLIFIFAVSAIKEAFDDWNRMIRDKKANERTYQVVRGTTTEEIKSMDIRVGDILLLNNNEEIPCDVVVLSSSDPDGMCYVQTSNLDGETDYKPRQAPRETCAMTSPQDLGRFRGVVECASPNADIYKFDSRMNLNPDSRTTSGASWVPLSAKNVLLQATHLRNTNHVYGLTVYTGNETKVGQNKREPPYKLTKLTRAVNTVSVFIFALQFTLVLIFGAVGEVWRRTNGPSNWYLSYPPSDQDPWYMPAVIPLRFLLLNSLMIPVSLKVTMDVIKYTYAMFINWDLKMYDSSSNTPATANNTAISEDLGQVQFVFSDKTGTLTENIMVFRKCSIGGRTFGTMDSTPGSTSTSGKPNDSINDEVLRAALARGDPDALEFFRALALCHTVVTSSAEDGTVEYQASSPDEEALVSAAANLDVKFTKRDLHSEEIMVNGSLEKYELLHVLEFNSVRKRMSVILRDGKSDGVMLYCKGADDTVLPRLHQGNPRLPSRLTRTRSKGGGRLSSSAPTSVRAMGDSDEDDDMETLQPPLSQVHAAALQHIEEFAKVGLRTLCVANRRIPTHEYEAWARTLEAANGSMQDRDAKVSEAYDQIEKNMQLLGISAIEDRLQEEVPETIELLRTAGIKVWMLTGDKLSTAVQIATSCRLLGDDPRASLLTISSEDDIDNLQVLAAEVLKRGRGLSIIVEGHILEKILARKRYTDAFFASAVLAGSVVCCRVTPHQKAQVVSLVKEHDYITLAVGDGGNDVSMIQAANVGVGISGREGLQASRASDYSIGRFRFLQRLLLVHGRFSYHRTAFVALYCFYKSLFICFMQVMFQAFDGFSGTTFFNSFSLLTYNILWTGLPVVGFVFDKDLSEHAILHNPQIYKDSQRSRSFNPLLFAIWLFRALFQAFLVFVITTMVYWALYGATDLDYNSISILPFTASVILQQLTLLIQHNSLTYINHLLIWGTIAAYFVVLSLTSLVVPSDMFYVAFFLGRDYHFWLALVAILVITLSPVVGLRYYFFQYHPTAAQVFQNFEASTLPEDHAWEGRRPSTGKATSSGDRRNGQNMVRFPLHGINSPTLGGPESDMEDDHAPSDRTPLLLGERGKEV